MFGGRKLPTPQVRPLSSDVHSSLLVPLPLTKDLSSITKDETGGLVPGLVTLIEKVDPNALPSEYSSPSAASFLPPKSSSFLFQSMLRTSLYQTEELSSAKKKRKRGTPGSGNSPTEEKKGVKMLKTSSPVLDEVNMMILNQDHPDQDNCPVAAKTTRTLCFTKEQTDHALLEKSVDILEHFVQTHEEQNEVQLVQKDVGQVLQSLKSLKKSKLIAHVDAELMLRLVQVLSKQVNEGTGLDVFSTLTLGSGNEEWNDAGIIKDLVKKIVCAIQAGMVLLLVLSTKDIDHRMLQDETIESICQLYKHCVHKVFLPALDSSFITLAMKSASSSKPSQQERTDDDHDDEMMDSAIIHSNKKPTSSRKRGSSHKKSQHHHSSANHHSSTSSVLERQIQNNIPVLCESIEALQDFILSVKLPDQWIFQMETTFLSIFEIESSRSALMLQTCSVAVLRAIFLQHPKHRSMIIQDMFALVIKLPTAKRNLRTFRLYDSEKNIQMVTALILSCIQSSISSTTAPKLCTLSEETAKMSYLTSAQDACRQLVGLFLNKCIMMKKKEDEVDYRVVLTNFTEDLLLVFIRPKWPAAETMLEILSGSLASILKTNVEKKGRQKHLESHMSLLALDLVGKICKEIRMVTNITKTYALQTSEDDAEYIEMQDRHRQYLVSKQKKSYNAQTGEVNGEELQASSLLNESASYHSLSMYMINRTRYEPMQIDARRYHLLFWAVTVHPVTLKNHHNHGQEDTQDLEESTQKTNNSVVVGEILEHLWESYWNNPSPLVIGTQAVPDAPNDKMAKRVALECASRRVLCQRFDQLLARVMALLTLGKPTFRARVVKVLTMMLDVDPMLMANVHLKSAVCRCFSDEGISVRQAAVDLVGRYILLQPELIHDYYDLVAERIRDTGVSVRKRVIRILHNILLSTNARRYHIKSMRKMVERIGDPEEETSIKDLVIETFEQAWFGSTRLTTSSSSTSQQLPPGWTLEQEDIGSTPKSLTSIAPPSFYVSPDGTQRLRSIDEVWAVTKERREAKSERPLVIPLAIELQQRQDMEEGLVMSIVESMIEVVYYVSSIDWFVDLIQRLLLVSSTTSTTTTKKKKGMMKSEGGKAEIKIKQRSECLVNGLMEYLMLIEEGQAMKRIDVPESNQLFACIKAISAFCQACPELLIPHVDTLVVYLQAGTTMSASNSTVPSSSSSVEETKMIGLVAGIISNVLPIVTVLSSRLVETLERDLEQLIYRASPSIVTPCIVCMARLVQHSHRPPQRIHEILNQFYGFAQKWIVKLQDHTTSRLDIPKHVGPSLQRALFSAGLILRHINLDEYDVGIVRSPSLPTKSTNVLIKGEILDMVFEMYQSYLNVSSHALLPPACVTKAVQGLGALYIAKPAFLVTSQSAGFLTSNMILSSNESVCIASLACISSVLSAEQRRLEGSSVAEEEKEEEKRAGKKKLLKKKPKSSRKQVSGDQEADASLISGIMQAQLANILKLAFHRNASIRREALSVMCKLLTQGLVSPAHCIPTLVALECDVWNAHVSELAHVQLVQLLEKFPQILGTLAIDGIRLSHAFQMRAFAGKCAIIVTTKDKDNKGHDCCVYGRFYSSCIRRTKSCRNNFLTSLVGLFNDKGSLLATAVKKGKSKKNKVFDLLCYLTQLLSSLPYELEEEPLLIIYVINRYVSLKATGLLAQLKIKFQQAGFYPELLEALDSTTDPSDEFDLSMIPRSIPRSDDSSFSTTSLLDLEPECTKAFAISLLLRLKQYLKRQYRLTDSVCQTFQPNKANSRENETPVDNNNVSFETSSSTTTHHLQLPDKEDLVADHPVLALWNQTLLFASAMSEDQRAVDFDPNSSSKTTKPRGSRRKSMNTEKDHLDDDPDFIG